MGFQLLDFSEMVYGEIEKLPEIIAGVKEMQRRIKSPLSCVDSWRNYRFPVPHVAFPTRNSFLEIKEEQPAQLTIEVCT